MGYKRSKQKNSPVAIRLAPPQNPRKPPLPNDPYTDSQIRLTKRYSTEFGFIQGNVDYLTQTPERNDRGRRANEGLRIATPVRGLR
jgi:hypothetical protein